MIPFDEVKLAPTLDLEIIESPSTVGFKHYIKLGQVFNLNARGLLNSKRNMNDGCVFFGTNPQQAKEGGLFGGFQPKNKEIINDVTLGDLEMNFEPSQLPGPKRNFFIRYKMDTKGYYLKDTGEGSGTFVRVDRPLVSQN